MDKDSQSGRKRSNGEKAAEREGTASFRFLMLRRGLHQPVARSRSHKKLGFERQPPSREPPRGFRERKKKRDSVHGRCTCSRDAIVNGGVVVG